MVEVFSLTACLCLAVVLGDLLLLTVTSAVNTVRSFLLMVPLPPLKIGLVFFTYALVFFAFGEFIVTSPSPPQRKPQRVWSFLRGEQQVKMTELSF